MGVLITDIRETDFLNLICSSLISDLLILNDENITEFIPIVIGEKNYKLLQDLKSTWDPNNIFNPGKIVNVPSMTSNLRYESDRKEPEIDTIFDFSSTGGILWAIEKCNGSGDCRKTEKSSVPEGKQEACQKQKKSKYR